MDKNYQSIDMESIDKHPSKTKSSTTKIEKTKSKLSKPIHFVKECSTSEPIKNNIDKDNVGYLSKKQLNEKLEKIEN